MKVGVAIPVIDLWDEYTNKLLDTITSKEHDIGILVIDNGSTDSTQEEMSKRVSDKIFYHRNETNAGVPKSWNYGLRFFKERGYDYVFILNNDALLNKHCIDELANWLTENPEYICVTAINVRDHQPDPKQNLGPHNIYEYDISHIERRIDENMIDAAAWMFRASITDTIGYFDENFFPAYFEDNDMHYRIKLSPYKIGSLSTALFYHFGSKTQNKSHMPVVPAILFRKNQDYYISKWGGPPRREKYTKPFNKGNK